MSYVRTECVPFEPPAPWSGSRACPTQSVGDAATARETPRPAWRGRCRAPGCRLPPGRTAPLGWFLVHCCPRQQHGRPSSRHGVSAHGTYEAACPDEGGGPGARRARAGGPQGLRRGEGGRGGGGVRGERGLALLVLRQQGRAAGAGLPAGRGARTGRRARCGGRRARASRGPAQGVRGHLHPARPARTAAGVVPALRTGLAGGGAGAAGVPAGVRPAVRGRHPGRCRGRAVRPAERGDRGQCRHRRHLRGAGRQALAGGLAEGGGAGRATGRRDPRLLPARPRRHAFLTARRRTFVASPSYPPYHDLNEYSDLDLRRGPDATQRTSGDDQASSRTARDAP
ncbi:hypothetical protein SGPA1_40904 [Streptomyces misionensis JCM 4497]